MAAFTLGVWVLVIMMVSLKVFGAYWVLEHNYLEIRKMLTDRDAYFSEGSFAGVKAGIESGASRKGFEAVEGEYQILFYEAETKYFEAYWREIESGTVWVVLDVDFETTFLEFAG